MLICSPRSLLSWDFEVVGGHFGPATIQFSSSAEGSIVSGGFIYVIRSHPSPRGKWTLEHGLKTLIEAERLDSLRPTIAVRGPVLPLVLRAGASQRTFELVRGNEILGTVRVASALGRQAFVKCTSPQPELLQLFCFWLVAFTWRASAEAAVSSL
jgi:hypothetical protein